MKTNHINIPDKYDNIYCEKNFDIFTFTEKFVETNCSSCPFFNGSAQGEGVECLYDNPDSKQPFVKVLDPYELFKMRKKALSSKNVSHVIDLDKTRGGK